MSVKSSRNWSLTTLNSLLAKMKVTLTNHPFSHLTKSSTAMRSLRKWQSLREGFLTNSKVYRLTSTTLVKFSPWFKLSFSIFLISSMTSSFSWKKINRLKKISKKKKQRPKTPNHYSSHCKGNQSLWPSISKKFRIKN